MFQCVFLGTHCEKWSKSSSRSEHLNILGYQKHLADDTRRGLNVRLASSAYLDSLESPNEVRNKLWNLRNSSNQVFLKQETES